MPPISRAYGERLYQLRPWCFTSRAALESSAYNIDWFVSELLQDSPEPYVLLEHAGHGVNSYALHFYKVDNHVGLFLQLPWGGLYGNRDEEVQSIRLEFLRIQQTTDTRSAIPELRRLVVVESGFHGSRWGWQDTTGSKQVSWSEIEPFSMVLPAVLAELDRRADERITQRGLGL